VTGKSGDTASARMLDPQDDEVRGSPDGLTDRRAAWAGVPGVGMSAGARTPEELETLLEDALVVRDREALAELFETGAVLVAGDERPARGGEEIARLALATWAGNHTYVADPRRVMQARDIALIIAEQGINVLRRGRDGAWRYAVVLRSVDDGTERKER
jgi:hypothetical protein